MKRVAAITLISALAQAFALAGDARPTPPLFKVTYGEAWGPSPLIFSYSVWSSGEMRYEPSPLKQNEVRTRQAKTLHVSPEVALRAVNELIKAGFLALRPEVEELSASQENSVTRLDHVILTHSQSLRIEFHFDGKDFKTEIDDVGTPVGMDSTPKSGKGLRYYSVG
jgi:hypothetical protein